MRRAVVLTVALVVLALLPAGAAAATQSVNAEFDTFSPSHLDVLPGETVTWTNVSPRAHTVTSDTALFDAGELLPGATFAQRLDAAGAYAYHCTIHPGMAGAVDVSRVILGPLPTAVVPFGERVVVSGRTADPARPVSVQRSSDAGAAAFATVASATPSADGSWSTTVTAEATGDYRAASGGDVSQARRLLVSSRRVRLRATRGGVAVTVTPSAPYARIMLQLDLPERFGWWPVARTRLDYLSQASFHVQRPARVRALLVAKDGWTPLATSSVVVLGKARATPMGEMHPHDPDTGAHDMHH